MKPLLSAALAAALSCTALQSSAYAVTQVPVAYVDSVTGLDGNINNTPACGRSTPCKTMSIALSAVTNPGIVIVVGDSEFAPFTISQGVTISCPNVSCVVNSSGGATAITVSAGASDTIILRHVGQTGLGTGANGVLVNSVGKLELHDVRLGGNSVNLNFSPSSGQGHLVLRESELAYAANQNILLAPTNSVSATALVYHSILHHDGAGIKADATKGGAGVSVTVEDSTINFHGNQGVSAVASGSGCPGAASGPFATIVMTHSFVSYSGGVGVNANGCSAFVVLNDTTIVQTGTGVILQNNGGVVSESNNAVTFNSTNVNGTLGHAAPQ